MMMMMVSTPFIQAIMGLSHDSQATLKAMIESTEAKTIPLQRTADGGYAMPSQQVGGGHLGLIYGNC